MSLLSARLPSCRRSIASLLVAFCVTLALPSPAAPQMPGRRHLGMILDPIRDRLIVFGGVSIGGATGDLWEFPLSGAPQQWRPLTAIGTGPSPRFEHATVYDPLGDRMLVYGGWNGTSSYQELWELKLTGVPAWNLITATGTAPVARPITAAFDWQNNQLLVLASETYNRTYILPLGAPVWSLLSTSVGPGGYVRMVYDPQGQDLLAQGSSSTYDRAPWTETINGVFSQWVPTGGIDPHDTSESGYSATYDAVLARCLVFGGERTTASYPGGPVGSTQVISETRGFWRIGQYHVVSTVNDPGGRIHHAAVFDAARNRMIMFGGATQTGELRNDVWALSLSGTPTWNPIVDAPAVGVGSDAEQVVAMSLSPMSPTPSSGAVRFEFTLPHAAAARIYVIDSQGRQVATLANGWMPEGPRSLSWDGLDNRGRVGSGVYQIVLESEGTRRVQKAVIVR